MSSTETYRTRPSAGNIIAQILTIGALFFFWRLGQKWVAVPAVLFLMFLFLFLPRLIRKKEELFHKEALRLLATGKAAMVPALARKQLLLQLFGSSAPIDAKLGLAYAQIQEYPSVISALDNAIPLAPASERPALQAALVKALFVTGDPARAETEGRHLLEREGTRLPEIMVILARARLGLGKMDPDTRNYLRDAETLSPTEDVQMMIELTRAELNMMHGRKPGPIPDDSRTTQIFLRAWAACVRGKVAESSGNFEAARRHYAKAVRIGKEDNCWFSNLAREHLETLVASMEEGATGNDDDHLDPAMRRKKKKRR